MNIWPSSSGNSKFVQLGGFAESHLEHRKKYSKRGQDCNRVLAWGPMCHAQKFTPTTQRQGNLLSNKVLGCLLQMGFLGWIKKRIVKYRPMKYQQHKKPHQTHENYHWSTTPSVPLSLCFLHLKWLWIPVSWNKKQDEVRTNFNSELLLSDKIPLMNIMLAHSC